MSAEKIKVHQAKVYDFLVKRGKVTSQVAESQATSESMAAIIPDATRVSKDGAAVAEAASIAQNLFFLSVAEEGISVHCAGRDEPWIAYGDKLLIVNPFDPMIPNAAMAWARREDIEVTSLGVISAAYLSQLRALHAGANQTEEERLNEKVALQVAEDLIRAAALADASDVHFVPNQTEKVDVLFRVDGILRAQKKIDLKEYETIVRAVLEQRCNVTLQSLTQQDGKFELDLDSQRSISLRVSTLPVARRSETCPKMVMRLLGNNASLVNLERLNLSKEHYDQLVHFGAFPNGMIVMTGPTGSGKTTTLSAVLINMQNSNPNRNFHTVEDPVEMQHQGMSHTEVRPGLTFAQALRALLRQDPDVILVGEMRDNETAELGYKASMTGHLVLTTLHTNNAHESIGRLERMDISTDILVANTTAFLAQRLVRRLCTSCRIEYRLSDDKTRLATYGQHAVFKEFKGETKLFRANPKGCHACGGEAGRGEKGRQSIIEILEVTPEVQVHLLSGMNPSILRRKQIADGTFKDLWDDALRLVAQGAIGFEQAESQLKPYAADRADVNAALGAGQPTPVPAPRRIDQHNGQHAHVAGHAPAAIAAL